MQFVGMGSVVAGEKCFKRSMPHPTTGLDSDRNAANVHVFTEFWDDRHVFRSGHGRWGFNCRITPKDSPMSACSQSVTSGMESGPLRQTGSSS